MIRAADFAPSRPPCSLAEREAARRLARAFRKAGFRPRTIPARAPTSATWAPLLRALARVWAAALLAAELALGARILAGVSLVAAVPAVGGLIRFVPLLGATTHSVVSSRAGVDREARPLLVTAHLDTHSTADAPTTQVHNVASTLSGLLVFVAAFFESRTGDLWRWLIAVVAAEAVISLVWLGRRELQTPKEVPDDNTSGLMSLQRVAELVGELIPSRDVWLAATGGGTSGSYGLVAILKRHRQLRKAWVIELDSLGAGEVVASPFAARFLHAGTSEELKRAVAAAARESGDPLTVRRVRRPHSDARAALRLGTVAIALTGGVRPPAAADHGPDPANAERAARIVDRLAHAAA
jgi:hypothetical protein